MVKGRILIPRGTLVNEEMEMIASKIFKVGYTVRKVKITDGPNKGGKYIEYWNGDDLCTNM